MFDVIAPHLPSLLVLAQEREVIDVSVSRQHDEKTLYKVVWDAFWLDWEHIEFSGKC